MGCLSSFPAKAANPIPQNDPSDASI